MEENKKIETLEDCVNPEGLKVNGIGILIKKADELIKLQDRTNQLLSFMEKKEETIIELLKK